MDMTDWKSQLEDFNLLLKKLRQNDEKLSKLRFDRRCVVASDVASQFYCEKKVELQYLHGEVETDAKNTGSEAHENLTVDSVKVKREELRSKIYGDKRVFALEMFLLAKHRDVVLAGKPDSVIFQSGFPLVIFEYKFSRSDVAYPSYHVQAQTYGVLLQNMGFDTTRLFYVIVVADPKTKGSRELRQSVVHTVLSGGLTEATHSVKDAKVYVCRFNHATAEKDLTWALEFWKNTREAQPANNRNKCKKCEYCAVCQYVANI